jgi:hypothetical protein
MALLWYSDADVLTKVCYDFGPLNLQFMVVLSTRTETWLVLVMPHLVLNGHWLVMWRGPAKGEEELSQRRFPQRLSTALCDEPCIRIRYRELKEATRFETCSFLLPH